MAKFQTREDGQRARRQRGAHAANRAMRAQGRVPGAEGRAQMIANAQARRIARAQADRDRAGQADT